MAPNLLRGLLRNEAAGTVLEITEHVGVQDYAALREAIATLGENVRFAVDDAGAGFASMRHILELAPSHVKLDRGLVARIETDPARQALVAGLVHFAGAIDVMLIAEGVETAEECETLLAPWCSGGTGIPLRETRARGRACRRPPGPHPGDGELAGLASVRSRHMRERI